MNKQLKSALEVIQEECISNYCDDCEMKKFVKNCNICDIDLDLEEVEE
jgi:hypothetical protein